MSQITRAGQHATDGASAQAQPKLDASPELLAILAKLAEPAAYTIPEFCRAHRISAPTFYKLAKLGLAPAQMRHGNCIRISREAAAAWRAARERPTGPEAEAVAAQAEAMRKRSLRAAAGAVRSASHVSNRRRAAAR
jgi:hypothetical protein